jgi:cysteine desulfurase
MLGNNEVGTLQSIAEIGAVCRASNVLFHTDAAQGAGHVPLDVNASCIDIASLSAHKMYGPKGIGALYVRRRSPRVQLAPIIHGGGHERGIRAGTLNVPAIVGFGEACRIAKEEMGAERQRLERLRTRLLHHITSQLGGVTLNGHPQQRLPGNLNLCFEQIEGQALLLALKDLAVSGGSACTSATLEPSYVLRAMGVPDDLALTSIRFGIGRFNTEEEIDHAASCVVEKTERLRRNAIR